jgi:transposase-like protein
MKKHTKGPTICPRCGDDLERKYSYENNGKVIYYICHECNWNDFEVIRR